MKTKSKHSYFWLIAFVISSVVTALNISAASASVKKVNMGAIGSIELNNSWIVQKTTDGVNNCYSANGSTKAKFSEITPITQDIADYLTLLSGKLYIPPMVRSIEKKQQIVAGVNSGMFIHGTVPDSTIDVTAIAPDSTLKNNQISSKYIIVIVYKKNNRLFQMEAETIEYQSGAKELWKIQRTWTLVK